jgi:ribulose-5-phosphate 4-epimerase/fuculose-1-phosphate aldolase
MVNQQDYCASVKLLRAALGKELPLSQERQLARLLGRKDESSYGARVGHMNDAAHLLEELEQFAAWAIQVLATKGVRPKDGDADIEACP